ncbi:uncharacterized protein LTR77_006236 [Saxophila tyrrhenica]|uniref:Glycosyltransferase family 32 protein n=1 Tax=Saxophila tyrrhenica TaxID=1690608 RepID=A0AAV9P7X5_9PEZI|nr:hypothetical protein LTR77_006236 [Saxophila tyrrhenica]
MRGRHALTIALVAVIGTLMLLRHHVRDLSEVARTYATFYSYLEQHPKTLFQYPAPAGESQRLHTEDELAPRIIHQIFLTEGRNSSIAKYEPGIRSCQAVHPDWTHNLWTDANATAFIAEHYPGVLPHYEGYKQSIQRANILRYALLDHFGGVYLDVDITCLHPLDDLRHVPFLTPGAYPAGVNNAFILTRPHHGFLQHLLEGVQSRDLFWGMPYIENMLSTGCMFFSNRWMSYARSLSASSPDADRQFILADEDGDIESHMLRGAITTPLFTHGGASSWHGWDAAAIVMIGKHYYYALALGGCGLLFATFGIWRCIFSRARGERRWQALKRLSMDKSDDREALAGLKEG